MRNYRDIPLWENVSEEEWNDWKWQVRNRITNEAELKQAIELSNEEESFGGKQCPIGGENYPD